MIEVKVELCDSCANAMIEAHDVVVRRVPDGYAIIKNRFGECGLLSEIEFSALRKERPTASVMVL